QLLPIGQPFHHERRIPTVGSPDGGRLWRHGAVAATGAAIAAVAHRRRTRAARHRNRIHTEPLMTTISWVFIVALFGLIGSGVWIGLSLLGTGWIALSIFRDMPLFKLLGQLAWNSSTTAELVALPLFILMAEILFRTKISEQMFDGLAPLASRLPGRLLHI